MDNRELVGQGLDITAEGLLPTITERFGELLPQVSDWTDVLREKDAQSGKNFDRYNKNDLLLQLRALTERFGTLGFPFSTVLDRQASTYASELRKVRNRWAHSEPFSAAEAYRALDTAGLLLKTTGATAQEERIAALKIEALTAMNPHIAPSAAPKPNPVQPDLEQSGRANVTPVGAQRHGQNPRTESSVTATATELSESLPKGATGGPGQTPKTAFEVSTVGVLSYALAHCRVPVLNEIIVQHEGSELRGASVTIEVDSPLGKLGDPKIVLLDLDGTNPTSLNDIGFTLDPGRMLSVDSQHEGIISFSLRDSNDELIAEHRHPVTILSSNQWIARPLQLGLETIAAFVQPNAAEIEALVKHAAELLDSKTGSSALDGYQSGSPERVDTIVESVYEAMQAREIRYAEPAASWGLNGQKVRTPSEVLAGRLGTCLDTTVTFAAALEEVGINSTLWFLEGHVFLGYWRQESSLDTPAEIDVSEAINYVGLGGIRPVETTSITLGEDFQTAVRRPALEHIGRGADHFEGITDIQQARLAGIFPLPSRALDASGEIVVREYRVATGPSALKYLPDMSRAEEHEDARLLPGRVTQWKNALLDLSLRNRLINYSSRAGHKLAVPQPKLAEFEDLINSGSSVMLVPSDDFPTIDRTRGIRSAFDLPETTLAALMTEKKRVHVALTADTYSTRLRALAYKARTISEETGANNLYLAVGMLRWSTGDRELRSPLVLVPVTLAPTARGQAYRITLDEAGESTPNYCLLEKLRVSFGIEIPGLANPIHDDSGIDIRAAFAATRMSLAEARLPFTIEDSIELAILQFAKFRLWKDLDDHWDTFTQNPLVDHLVHTPTEAFQDPVAPVEHHDLDEIISNLPVPADSSQAEAVVDAADGRTFVLEGPPGTGKSQTITNLLAHAVAEGKRVLFVAEKRAALDVVKQRLEAVGLGPLSLDLHDKGARPAVVRERLAAAMDFYVRADENSLLSNRESNKSALGTLSRYAERLHEPNAFGLSCYDARDRLLAAGSDIEILPIPPAFVRKTDPAAAESIRSLLRSLPETADLAAPRAFHPWGFVDARQQQVDVPATYAAARSFDIALGKVMNLGVAPSALALATSSEAVKQWGSLSQAPRYPLDAIDALRAHVESGAVADLKQELAQLATLSPQWTAAVAVEVLGSGAQQVHEHALAADQSGFFGRKKRQRAALSEFGGSLLADPKKFPPKEVSKLTFEVATTEHTVDALARKLRALPVHLIPENWNPFVGEGASLVIRDIDWLTWLVGTLSQQGNLSVPLLNALRQHYSASPANPELASALNVYAESWKNLDSLAGPASSGIGALSTWSTDSNLPDAWITTREQRRLDIDAPTSLQRWIDFLEHIKPLHVVGLEEAHDAIKSGELASDQASLAFDKGLAVATLAERQESQGLSAFNASAHNRAITRFNESTARIRSELPRSIPQRALGHRRVDTRFTGGSMGELKRQLARKRGGMSIRSLFEHFDSIIMQLTPCILMSPESVARFFPAKTEMFDIVVFDEASQVRVADAVGAMGRGKSVVVVGDSKQMPPTSFAETQLRDSDFDDTDSETVIDEESILTECVQARVPQKWLSWHYRSQDESLISFSNFTYYDGRLSSFPAPHNTAASDHGLSLIRVDGHFNRSEKGKLLRTNVAEAEAIVAEVARRFALSPNSFPSIGIVTFNAQQRALIETMLRDHPDDRLAEALDQRDGLFVKNLENVQGDERDTILFSIAFSANDRGTVPLNFGPLTRAGGERRLNVAITRARRQVMLFASFDPNDLRVEDTISVGIKHLKAYMEVAANGVKDSSLSATLQPIVDRHRDEIANELRLRGFAVQTDIGLSDFRVDISVAKAENPDQPVLAVLLDGESWRSRRTVADRDGLPSEVLERLMQWPAVERVWLPEWLQDHDGTLDRLSEAVEQAAARATITNLTGAEATDAVDLSSDPGPSTVSPQDGAESAHAVAALPVYASSSRASDPLPSTTPSHEIVSMAKHPRLEIFAPWNGVALGGVNVLDDLPGRRATSMVRDLISEIVAEEGPIHREHLAKIVGDAFGLSRVASSRVKSILSCVPVVLIGTEGGNFIWPNQHIPGNYLIAREASYGERRDIDLISLQEIANAMAIVAELSGGADNDTLHRETLALFGGKRITAGIGKRLKAAMEFAEQSERILKRGELWHPGSLS